MKKKHISKRMSTLNKDAIAQAKRGYFLPLELAIDKERTLSNTTTKSTDAAMIKWAAGMRCFHTHVLKYLLQQLDEITEKFGRRYH